MQMDRSFKLYKYVSSNKPASPTHLVANCYTFKQNQHKNIFKSILHAKTIDSLNPPSLLLQTNC